MKIKSRAPRTHNDSIDRMYKTSNRLSLGAKIATGVALCIAVPFTGKMIGQHNSIDSQFREYTNSTYTVERKVGRGETMTGIQKQLLGRDDYSEIGKEVIKRGFIEDNNLPDNFDFRKLQQGKTYIFRDDGPD
ncbi:MAG: hypothetical protein ACOCUU_03910 [Nanoarchaeota archaeon]